MAIATAVFTTPNITGATVSSTVKSQKPVNKALHIGGLNSYGGLKAQNSIISLGMPLSTEKCFARVVSSMKGNGKGKKGGGALSSTCDAGGEIFRIAAIMNGLVLVGVAVGFVLLRIEAWLEESEA